MKFKRYVPYLIIILFYMAGRFLILQVGTGNPHVENLGRPLIFFNSGKAFLLYLGRLFLPFRLNAYIMMELSTFPNLLTLGGLALIICLIVWFWKEREKAPLLSFALSTFLLTLIPLSNLVPLNAPRDIDFPMAERFLYIPSFSFCLFLGVIFEKAISYHNLQSSLRRAALTVAVLFVAFYFIRTVDRNRDWKREFQFYLKTVEVSPRSAIFRNNLGILYKRNGDPFKGEKEFREAIRLMPDLAQAYDNLGNLYYDKGLYPQAIKEYQNALAIDDQAAETYSNLGATYLKMGEYEESEESFKKAIQLKPAFAESHFNLGAILGKLGKYDEAVKEYNLALKLKPELAPAYLNLAVIYLEKFSDKNMAVYHFRRCLEIDPNQPQAEAMKKKIVELQGLGTGG